MKYDLSAVIDFAAPDFDLVELLSLASAKEPDSSAVFLISYITEGGFNLTRDVVDFGDSNDWIKLGAEQGDPLCMAKYSAILTMGRGIDINKKLGEQYVSKALGPLREMAESGHAYAQTMLGVLCSRGIGCRPDQTAALAWYVKAAEQGEPNAAANIGMMYKEGVVIRQDLVEAEVYLRRAADKGHASAQFNLGGLYLDQKIRDLDNALEWYNASAQQGHVKAQRMLAEVYNIRHRVSGDPDYDALAFKWLKSAADKGDVEASIIAAGRIVTERRAGIKAVKEGLTPEKTVTDAYDMGDAYEIYSRLLAVPLDNRSRQVVEQQFNTLKMSSTLEKGDEKPVRRFLDGSGVAETIIKLGKPKPKAHRR